MDDQSTPALPLAQAPPILGQPPAWATLALRQAADGRALAAAVAVAVVLDQALRSGAVGVAAALTVLAAAAGLLLSRRLPNWQARALVALAPAFGLWFGLRASPWLLLPDLAAVSLLLGAGVALGARGSVFDVTLPAVVNRGLHLMAHSVAAPGFVFPAVKRLHPRLRQAAPALRGALLAAPVVLTLGLLLASADPIFASFLHIGIDVGALVADCFYLVVGTWTMAGLLRAASAQPIEAGGPSLRPLGIEALVVLGAVDVVFVAFAAAQIIGATGAGAATLRAAGVTYSDYARSGFFQLLWAAGITLAVLLAVRALADLSSTRNRRLFVLLAELACLLTLLIVFVSVRRLALYEEVYGYSMLRLYSQLFAGWIGLVFILLGVAFARPGSPGRFGGDSRDRAGHPSRPQRLQSRGPGRPLERRAGAADPAARHRVPGLAF